MRESRPVLMDRSRRFLFLLDVLHFPGDRPRPRPNDLRCCQPDPTPNDISSKYGSVGHPLGTGLIAVRQSGHPSRGQTG